MLHNYMHMHMHLLVPVRARERCRCKTGCATTQLPRTSGKGAQRTSNLYTGTPALYIAIMLANVLDKPKTATTPSKVDIESRGSDRTTRAGCSCCSRKRAPAGRTSPPGHEALSERPRRGVRLVTPHVIGGRWPATNITECEHRSRKRADFDLKLLGRHRGP